MMKTSSKFMPYLVIAVGLLWPISGYSQKNLAGKGYGEQEDFKRSTLCVLLLNRAETEYAEEIEQQFLEMPLPDRYNSLNTDVRVMTINTYADVKPRQITQWLSEQQVAKQLVSKWFNRDSNGNMNMERIGDWGGYNATFSDVKRAEHSLRGMALLSDEGEELLKNTFVLVCDISYYNREETKLGLAILGGTIAGALTGQLAGDFSTQDKKDLIQSATTAGAAIGMATDIAGFGINMTSYLYRLHWDNQLLEQMYNEYWVDDQTPSDIAQTKKDAFDRDNKSFYLDYLGNYYSHAGKTVKGSRSNLDEVIRNVCADAVEESVTMLARMYPVFKTTTKYYCDGNTVYSYVGTKEGVTEQTKYEVVEREITRNGPTYNHIAWLNPVKGKIWNNNHLRLGDEGVLTSSKGTAFQQKGKSNLNSDICVGGQLMRESGGALYNYHYKHMTHLALDLGSPMDNAAFAVGYELDWIKNNNPHFSWNFLSHELIWATDFSYMDATLGMGCIFRSNMLKGKYTLFLWPTIGGMVSLGKDDEDDYAGLDWRIKFGTYIGRNFTASAFAGQKRFGIQFGYIFKSMK